VAAAGGGSPMRTRDDGELGKRMERAEGLHEPSSRKLSERLDREPSTAFLRRVLQLEPQPPPPRQKSGPTSQRHVEPIS
jgi:hypothetical protein